MEGRDVNGAGLGRDDHVLAGNARSVRSLHGALVLHPRRPRNPPLPPWDELSHCSGHERGVLLLALRDGLRRGNGGEGGVLALLRDVRDAHHLRPPRQVPRVLRQGAHLARPLEAYEDAAPSRDGAPRGRARDGGPNRGRRRGGHAQSRAGVEGSVRWRRPLWHRVDRQGDDQRRAHPRRRWRRGRRHRWHHLRRRDAHDSRHEERGGLDALSGACCSFPPKGQTARHCDQPPAPTVLRHAPTSASLSPRPCVHSPPLSLSLPLSLSPPRRSLRW